MTATTIQHGLAPDTADDATANLLRAREIAVLQRFAMFKANAEIVDVLHISEKAVEYLMAHILNKIWVQSHWEVAR